MAKGRAWRNRLLLLLAVSTFTLLIVADIMPNPFPPMWDWINRERPIAAEVDWQERLGGRPSAAGVPGSTVVADAGRRAAAFDRATGEEILDWTADWLTVAGTDGNAVVITGETLSRGYQVRDPATGTPILEDEDARAVWGFRQVRIDLRCDGARSCELRAYRPDSPVPLWATDLPGAGSGLVGADPDLTTASVRMPARVHERVGAPEDLPLVLGVPIDRQRVAIVHSGTGELLAVHDAGRDELIMVVGDRVLRSVAIRRDGVCQVSVIGHDAFTGNVVWGPHPYNLRTITGGGCEQQYAAVAAGAALIAVDPEGKELILDAGDGRVLWRGEPDERVQGLTEDMAVIKAADPAIRYAVLLGRDRTPRWTQRVDPNAEVVIVDCGIVVADREPNRLRVWDPVNGEERLSVRTSARMLACAPDGLVLASGRSLGFVPFGGPRSDPGTTIDDK
jgi:outer membrane protein assembly factor BamB